MECEVAAGTWMCTKKQEQGARHEDLDNHVQLLHMMKMAN
jgi:hypothetical protein